MGQRNMMVDLEMEPEPYIFPQPDIPGVITASGNAVNLEAQPLPDSYNNSMFYGVPQYHHHHHASNLDVGISAAPNFYFPFMSYHTPPCQFPSSSSHGVDRVMSDEYKTKNTEGPLGNSQYITPVASSSSLGPLHRPGVASMDHVLSHGQNNFIQGTYAGQPFPPSGSIWFDQHQRRNGGSDGPPSLWPQPPSVPYMPGSIESSSRNPAAFVHPFLMNPRHHYYNHHPPPPPPPIHNASVYPHMGVGSNHVGPVQPSGFRTYRQHYRENPVSETSVRHRGLPRLRVLPNDDVALLEVGDLYDAGNDVDNHRDMRLDIEDMSYEDLLALSERIGTVNTGLSEEKVKDNLKTRTYLSTGINLEEAPPSDLETDSCIICQEKYKNREKIGTLDCGHEYHAECLENWLLVKNVCPICKSEALGV